LINISNQIKKASDTCDLASIAYNLGKMAKIIMKAEPIEDLESTLGYSLERRNDKDKDLSIFDYVEPDRDPREGSII
jgi:hypothetical protein